MSEQDNLNLLEKEFKRDFVYLLTRAFNNKVELTKICMCLAIKYAELTNSDIASNFIQDLCDNKVIKTYKDANQSIIVEKIYYRRENYGE